MVEVIVSRLGLDSGTQTYVVVLQEKGGSRADVRDNNAISASTMI